MNINKKLKDKIKLLILDVDGVLSDGKIYVSNNGQETKSFDVKDGLGIKLLLENGIEIAIISGDKSNATKIRLIRLGIKHIYLGVKNKINAFNHIRKKLMIKNKNIAYIGDDTPDIPILKKVGFSVAVNDAIKEVLEIASYNTKKNGGHGAVREVCDIILNLSHE